MSEAYMTIDDSPTIRCDQILNFLEKRKIQALFFCRGDFMEENPQQAKNILRQGHILGNHLYSHRPASALGFDAVKTEIETTEKLIDLAYQQTEVKKPGKYLRFPYLDRGNGIKTEQSFQDLVKTVQDGSDDTLSNDHDVSKLQEYLIESGYSQPFKDVNHPLYRIKDIRDAADCLLTFTSFDWMLSPRHAGRQEYTNVQALKQRIDNDSWLLLESSVNVVLFHDDKEGIVEQSCELIDHMISRGITFKEYT